MKNCKKQTEKTNICSNANKKNNSNELCVPCKIKWYELEIEHNEVRGEESYFDLVDFYKESIKELKTMLNK